MKRAAIAVFVLLGAAAALMAASPTSGQGRLVGIHVKDFGAKGDGSTDDSAAVQAAITAAVSSTVIYFDPNRTYNLNSAVSTTRPIQLVGNGSTIRVNGNYAFITTAAVDISGFTFNSSSTATIPDVAIYGSSTSTLNGTRIHDNKFGRVSIYLSDGSPSGSGSAGNANALWIYNNKFTGDYTNVPYGGDLGNIIQTFGWSDVFIHDNAFEVAGQERFLKITDTSRRVHINNNSFKSTISVAGRQAIDLFTDSREVVVTGNTFDVVGEVASACVEQKTGDGGAYTSEPSEIIVSHNICKVTTTAANFTAFPFFGSWGLASQTLTRSTLNVSDNIILATATTTDALVVARGFTHANISNNIIWRSSSSTTFTQSIEASNNRQTSVSGNVIEYGYIMVNGLASHPNGTTYGSFPERVLITGNQIRGWQSLGGIYLVNTTSTDVAISNNILVSNPTSSSNGYVQLTNAAITRLMIHGNTGYNDYSGDVTLSGTSTVSAWNMSGNSWQTTTTTWDPGTITVDSNASKNITLPGAQIGDVVSVGLPYDLQGTTLVPRVSATSTVNILLWNKTSTSTAFATGTWRVSVSR